MVIALIFLVFAGDTVANGEVGSVGVGRKVEKGQLTQRAFSAYVAT